MESFEKSWRLVWDFYCRLFNSIECLPKTSRACKAKGINFNLRDAKIAKLNLIGNVEHSKLTSLILFFSGSQEYGKQQRRDEKKEASKLRLRSHYEAKDSPQRRGTFPPDAEEAKHSAKHDKWLFFIRKLYLFLLAEESLAREAKVSFINYSVRMRILQNFFPSDTQKKYAKRMIFPHIFASSSPACHVPSVSADMNEE